MLKPIFILLITLIAVYFGLSFIDKQLEIPVNEIFTWIGIILLALIIERILKYFLNYPLKLISQDLKGFSMAQGIQNIGFAAAYISLWLSIGVTPINAIVQGNYPEKLISNPLFLKVAGIFAFTTLLFTIFWIISSRVSQRKDK